LNHHNVLRGLIVGDHVLKMPLTSRTAMTVQSPASRVRCVAVEVWPFDLVVRVRSILQLPIRQPSKPDFSFDLTMESAEKNFLILMKKYGGSLKAALDGKHKSHLGMGSEFRPIEALETIYGNHPIWRRMVPILQQGSTWPLEEISKEQRLSDVLEAIKFGNHKEAQSNPEAILSLVSKDVKHGYAVAFPLAKAHLIPGILIAPMNIMHQNTIDRGSGPRNVNFLNGPKIVSE